jgi:HTH-type transcriptional regulator / antitoxin HigA
MPVTYRQLLEDALPQIIETPDQYRDIHQRFGLLFDRGNSRTPDETRFMRLLGLLIEDYDRRNALPPVDDSPAERLQFLMEVSGKTAADLMPIFGQKSHVSEALSGVRPISADQARQLGEMFHLNPGYFL